MTDAGKQVEQAHQERAFRFDLGAAIINRHERLWGKGPITPEQEAERALLGLILHSVGEVGDYDGPPEGCPHPLSRQDGYAGVKDAEVNNSLPTQGGGAGDRETVARIIREHVKARPSSRVMLERITGTYEAADAILSALQAAPSEGGEPVAWLIEWVDDRRGGVAREAIITQSKKDAFDANIRGYRVTPLGRLNACPPAPSEEPLVGWIVGNGNEDRWRGWDQGHPVWVEDRSKATRYARREDAEAVHAEDEDAWRVTPYVWPAQRGLLRLKTLAHYAGTVGAGAGVKAAYGDHHSLLSDDLYGLLAAAPAPDAIRGGE